MGPRIAALALWPGPPRGSPPLARLGIADRPAGDRAADLASRAAQGGVARVVQISAQCRRGLSDRPEPDRRGRHRLVGGDLAGAGAEGDARRSIVPDDLDRLCRHPRTGVRRLAVRGAWAPLWRGSCGADGGPGDGACRLSAQRLSRDRLGLFYHAAGPQLFRQRHLRDRVSVHGGVVAGVVARQRFRARLRDQQHRQVYRSGWSCPDRRRVELRQPQGDAGGDRAGFQLLRVLVSFSRSRPFCLSASRREAARSKSSTPRSSRPTPVKAAAQ